jgi:signal transduction histidine kinase
MELEAFCSELRQLHPEAATAISARQESIQEELERLRRFTRDFTSFAALPRPDLLRDDLQAFLEEFISTFRTAWSAELSLNGAITPPYAVFDRGLLRQVLVNLCSNSGRSGAERVVIAPRRNDATIDIEVTDDGSGVDARIIERLYEPYVTTRAVGEGMGLGLAISKKIMLDHNGDLQLIQTTTTGTTFRLTLQAAEESR